MASITARRRLLESLAKDGTPLGRFTPLEVGYQSNVRTLNLAQPNLGNPINSTLANQISREIDRQNENKTSQLLILHSTRPDMFSKGLVTGSQSNLKAANRLRKAIQRASKPTIAVFDGVVENAGYSAFAECDYLIGTETTQFAIKGFLSGNFPFGAGLLGRIIRKNKKFVSVARYLTLTEREIDAVDMSDLRLVDYVTPTRPQEALVFALEQTVPTEGDRVEVLRSKKADLMIAQMQYMTSDELWQRFSVEKKYGPDSRLPLGAPYSTMPMHYRYQPPHIDTSGEMIERILITLDSSWTDVTDKRVNPYDAPVLPPSTPHSAQTREKKSSGMDLLRVTESEVGASVEKKATTVKKGVREEVLVLDDVIDPPTTDVVRGFIPSKMRHASIYANTKGGAVKSTKHHSQRRLSDLYPWVERFFSKPSARMTMEALRTAAQRHDTPPDLKAWARDTLEQLSKVPVTQSQMLFDFTKRLEQDEDPIEEEIQLLSKHYDDVGKIRS